MSAKRASTPREKEIYKVTLVGAIVNFLLLVFKYTAGIVGRSSAMIADATHSLTDFVTDIILVVFVRLSGKPQDTDHHYGHGKYETLASAIIGISLLFVGIGIMINATTSIIDFFQGKPLEAPGMVALVAAFVSIVFKEVLFRYTMRIGKKVESNGVIANAWDHRTDALSSIGTLLGIGGAIFLGEKWRVLDPIAALVVSIFIIKVSIQLIRPNIDELMEKSLPKEMEDRILEIVNSFPQVSDPHNLRTRRVGHRIAIEIHIRMDAQLSLTEAHDISKQMEQALRKEFGEQTHIGIHYEPTK